MHAFPIGARMWEPQHALAASGWHVVMPQFRGFDCTTADGPDAQTLDDYAGDVADLLETLAVKRAVIGGLSMGGYVSFALYRRSPDLFQGLVLADTRAEADTPEARTNRTKLIALAGTDGVSAVADEMMPRLLGKTTIATQPQVKSRLRTLIAANQPRAIQAALRGMMTRDDSVTLLPTIQVPALVIVGAEDELTPPALSRTMAAALPDATLVVIPGAGHLSSMEQPQAFNAALDGFLRKLEVRTEPSIGSWRS